MNYLVKIPIYVLSGLMVAGTLAGCQATVDTHWATTQDTLDHWEPLVSKLPVEVRGQLPNASNAQIASAIPNALPVQSPVSAGSSDPVPAPTARLVVQVGGEVPGSDRAYCSEPVSRQASANTAAPTIVTLTLCDGARVVAQSSSTISPGNADAIDLSRKFNHLKNLALIGIQAHEPRVVGSQG